MKGFFIAASIVCAWVSGVSVGSERQEPPIRNGSLVFLVLAIGCGIAAWTWK